MEFRTGSNGTKRTLMAANLAAIAVGIGLQAPSPGVAADLLHQVSGQQAPVETALVQVARDLYGSRVFAHCAPIEGGHGKASPLYRTIRLDTQTCKILGDVIAHPESADNEANRRDVATAVYTYAHEISHVVEPDGAKPNWKYDEGITSCIGAQRSEEIAGALGISGPTANAIGALAAVVANAAPNQEYNIPTECKDGGRYDINAPGNHFPQNPTAAYINGR